MEREPGSDDATTGIEPTREIIPPTTANPDAERALIASVLYDPDVFTECTGIDSERFTDHRHKLIWQAIERLASSRMPIDVVTLGAELRRANTHGDAGGTEYLTQIDDSAFTAANATYYADELRKLWKQRRLAQLGEQIMTGAQRGTDLVPLIHQATQLATTSGAPQQEQLYAQLLQDVQPENMRWLWFRRLAFGHMTILGGQAGTGKSMLVCDIIARVTTGRDWIDAPNGARNEPLEVVIIGTEDGLADTWRPRLNYAKADCSKVHAIGRLVGHGGKEKRGRRVDLTLDTDILTSWLRMNPQVKLVVIDPITSYLGDKNQNRNTEVRAVLDPLVDMAEELGVAILLTAHHNKGTGPALYRISGATAFGDVPRMAFQLTKDPEDPLRVLFQSVKDNVGKAKDMSFRRPDDEKPNPNQDVGITWDGLEVTITADQAVDEDFRRNVEKNKSKTLRAIEFLLMFLADGKARTTKEVRDAAAGEGVTPKDLENARFRSPHELKGLKYYQHDGERWWRLSMN